MATGASRTQYTDQDEHDHKAESHIALPRHAQVQFVVGSDTLQSVDISYATKTYDSNMHSSSAECWHVRTLRTDLALVLSYSYTGVYRKLQLLALASYATICLALVLKQMQRVIIASVIPFI
jgi:hypothetical protein